MAYKYYSTLRPVTLGTYPKPNGNEILAIQNYGSRICIDGIRAWGSITYSKKISSSDAEKYDLVANQD